MSKTQITEAAYNAILSADWDSYGERQFFADFNRAVMIEEVDGIFYTSIFTVENCHIPHYLLRFENLKVNEIIGLVCTERHACSEKQALALFISVVVQAE